MSNNRIDDAQDKDEDNYEQPDGYNQQTEDKAVVPKGSRALGSSFDEKDDGGSSLLRKYERVCKQAATS